jgi:queuosine precursor transporter
MIGILKDIDRATLLKLMLLHTAVVAISNYLVNFKFTIFGSPIAYSTLSYPIIFIATDLTVRLLGKQMARTVIGVSVIPGIVASITVILATGAPESVAYRIALASGLSYMISQLLDVYVFQFLRERYTQWWIAPLVSGNLTVAISTYIFFAAAFMGSANAFMAENWPVVATNGVVGKLLFGSALIVPLYGVVLNYLLGKMKSDDSVAQAQ